MKVVARRSGIPKSNNQTNFSGSFYLPLSRSPYIYLQTAKKQGLLIMETKNKEQFLLKLFWANIKDLKILMVNSFLNGKEQSQKLEEGFPKQQVFGFPLYKNIDVVNLSGLSLSGSNDVHSQDQF